MKLVTGLIIAAATVSSVMAAIKHTSISEGAIEKAKQDCIANMLGKDMNSGLVTRKFVAWKMRYKRYVEVAEKDNKFLHEKFRKTANDANDEIYKHYCPSAPKESRLPVLE